MAILNALFNQDRTALEVIEAVTKATKGSIKIRLGSIYTQLDRLEKEGLVRGYYKDNPPPERRGHRKRYYEITGAGQRALTEQDGIRSWRGAHV